MHTGHSGATSQDGLSPPHSDKSTIEGCLFCIPHPVWMPVLSALDLIELLDDLVLNEEDLGPAKIEIGIRFIMIAVIRIMYFFIMIN